MGVVVSKDRLRPYSRVQHSDTDDCFTSINLETGSSNGMHLDRVPATSQRRWQKMFTGAQQHRFAPQGDGR